ncbi:MAG: PAS domain S-box protein [Vicinamibacterales bacterium]
MRLLGAVRPPPPADADDLAIEQVAAHVDYFPLAAAGTGAVAVLLGAGLAGAVPPLRMGTWMAALLVPFAWRFVIVRRLRAKDPSLTPRLALGRFRATFAVHGAIWGLASVLMFPANDIARQSLLAFVIGGVTASSITAAAFDLTAGWLFLVMSVVPLSVRMLTEGGPVAASMGTMLVLYLAYMTANSVRLHRRYVETFSLRRSAARRADALAALQTALGRMWQVEAGAPLELMRVAAQETAAALRLYRALVCLFDRTDGTARVVAAAGPGASPVDTMPPTPLSALPGYEAALAGAVHLDCGVPAGAAAFKGLADCAVAPTPGTIRLDVPLRIGGHVEGAFCCERAGDRRWTDDEIGFLTAAAATLRAASEEAQRRQAERALRELNQELERRVEERTSALAASEARLAQAFEVANDGLWDVDLVSGTVYRSPVLARLLGYTGADLPERFDEIWALMHPEDAPAARAALDEHLAGRRPSIDVEVRVKTASGEYRWFRDHGQVVERAADGTPRRILGTISDITDRRRAVAALHESEARFRALFDKSPLIVTLVDLAESRVAEMNELGLQMFGYAKDDVLGRTTMELGLWGDEGARRRAVRQLMADQHISGIELQLRRKDGETFWALLSATIVMLGGRPYALTTLQDVTERRELEARVLQSQKMEVVGHLAGGIAHDFNNVLTVITSTAELAIEDSPAGSPVRDSLETIRQASLRAAGLTRQLLAFSRRQVLRPAPVDLNETVAALAPIVRRAVGEGVAVEFRPAPDPAIVVADRGSLDQVVLNLAINARDAMPDGGRLTIAIGLETIDAGPTHPTALAAGPYVTLTIRDTGHGMSEATKRRVFEPFFTTKEVGKGTGLGLSVAHGIIAQSGGAIIVESAPGAGATFAIYLPAAQAPAAQATPDPARALSPGRGRVLVVDDDADIRSVIGRALGHAGYDVIAAGNGLEALEVLTAQAGRVDLVLTDVMMPGMDGADLAARVKDEFPSVRMLFTSGYAESVLAKRGVFAGGIEFLAKPYTLRALTEKVRGVLGR